MSKHVVHNKYIQVFVKIKLKNVCEQELIHPVLQWIKCCVKGILINNSSFLQRAYSLLGHRHTKKYSADVQMTLESPLSRTGDSASVRSVLNRTLAGIYIGKPCWNLGTQIGMWKHKDEGFRWKAADQQEWGTQHLCQNRILAKGPNIKTFIFSQYIPSDLYVLN